MKQKTILFMMASGYGHLNPTFELSNRLKELNYRVVFAAPSNVESYIKSQGFEVVLANTLLFSLGNGFKIGRKQKAKKILHQIVDRINNFQVTYTNVLAKEMNKVIEEVRPNLVFIDSIASVNYFFIEKLNFPVVLLQTMLGTTRRRGIPPLNSALMPGDRREFNSMRVNVAWVNHIVKRKINQLFALGDSITGVTIRIGRSKSMSIKNKLDDNNSFRAKIKDVEEFVIGPKSLDYDEITPVNQLYLAGTINRKRKSIQIPSSLTVFLDKLKSEWKGRRLVYCSLGTLNLAHNKNCVHFFQKVIDLISGREEYALVLSIGELDKKHLEIRSDNIYMNNHVPQIELLEKCDVMITHGGLNSVLECIDNTVPMLLYPLNRKWDQEGNSSRVCHYGLGLRGEIGKASVKSIDAKLNRLLADSSFEENLRKMRRSISQENGIEKALEIIEHKVAHC